MKILYHHRTQADDGQAVHIRALQRAFREIGHEVFEVSLVQQDADPEAGRSRWSWITRLPRFMLELAEYSYSGMATRRIVRRAKQLQPDFIYERYAFGNLGGVSAARRLGIPLVLEVNSPMVDELLATRGLAMPRLARRVELAIFKAATRICVVTEVLKGLLVELGVEPGKIIVTPNGVHPGTFDYERLGGRRLLARRARRQLGLEPQESRCVLGFVGYFREWHRLDLVVELLAAPGFEELVFCVIGEGPAEPGLRTRAEELGVTERLCFAGPRSHDQIAELLVAFDIALMPAINPYASALKLHEYMAAGLAIVAPDQPNVREVLVDERSALLIPPGELQPLEVAVRRLLEDEPLRAALGTQAAATIETLGLTWQANARRVTEAIHELEQDPS